MSFTQRFELLALVRDDGVKTFQGRERDTGRPVLVHLVVNPKTPENSVLLAMVGLLPEHDLQRILDRGEHEGQPYLVTDRLAEYAGLREWLTGKGPIRAAEEDLSVKTFSEKGVSEKSKPQVSPPEKSPAGKNPMTVAGAWKVPPPPAAPVGGRSLDDQFAGLFETREMPSPPDEQPGEFTKMLQGPPPLPKPAQAVQPPPLPPPAPPPLPPASPGPGEFTRLFQAPGPAVIRPNNPPLQNPPAQNPVAQNRPPNNQPVIPSNPSLGNQPSQPPGEFTRLFQVPPPPTPVSAPPAAPPRSAPPAAPPSHQPGEFTRMFQAPPPPATAQQTVVPSPPPQSPPAPAPVRNNPPSQTPGEFTRMFQVPAPPPPSSPAPVRNNPPSQPPGEFTRMFQAPGPQVTAPPPTAKAPAPPLSNPPSQQPGEFTRLFQVPAPPITPQTVAPPPLSAPPLNPQPVAAPPPQAPPPINPPSQQPGEFTRMFQAPARPPSAPAPASKSGPPSMGPGEFTRLFQAPVASGPMPQSPAMRQPLTPQAPGTSGGNRVGEFTRVFGPGEVPTAPPPATPVSSAPSGATQTFTAQPPGPPPVRTQTGPGEYTRMFSVEAPLTLGQPSLDAPPPPNALQPAALPPAAPSRLPLILGLSAVVILLIALIVYLIFRSH